MTKKQFIQSVLCRSIPGIDKAIDAIRYAEQLWEVLSSEGYGAAKKDEKPREGVDYYDELNPRQRHYFDKFWNAFAYKEGRNEAAMEWAKLGQVNSPEYEQIIQAASREASKVRAEGQVRKMAQGWLKTKRYLDNQPGQTSQVNAINLVINRLNNDLLTTKKLYESSKDPALFGQIQKLEQALKDARNTNQKQQEAV